MVRDPRVSGLSSCSLPLVAIAREMRRATPLEPDLRELAKA